MSALWSAGPRPRFSGVRPCAQNWIWAVSGRPEKRRQAAALQNVGMPTIKVLLEVPYWNFGVGE